MRWLRALALALLVWPVTARAMPPVVAAVALIAVNWGAVAVAGTMMFAGLAVTTWTAMIMVSSMVYGQVKARDARRAARNAYNDSVADRNITLMSAEAPWQAVYGECIVGGRVVAMLTSGDRDQYKHLVIVWADHECDAITDVQIAGASIGPLDANGNVTTGKWLKPETLTVNGSYTFSGAGSITLDDVPTELLAVSYLDGVGEGQSEVLVNLATATLVGAVLTVHPDDVALWAGRTVDARYVLSHTRPLVRVRHHLGAPGQTADASLLAECPADWSATDVGNGKCYSVVRLDLDEPEFQGGPPALTVSLRGRRVYDPRSSTTIWSANNALCTADFLMAPWGKRALTTMVNWSDVSAAANDCDTPQSSLGGAPLYTCHGAITTDRDPDQVLDQLCQSMAGFVTWTGEWRMQAGVYTAPVMALTDSDAAGSIEIIDTPSGGEVFNGVRGKFFDPGRFNVFTDYPSYWNNALRTADGEELWEDVPLPFTNSSMRCHNIARILVERSRAMQLVFPAKLRALRLRAGQRVTLANSMLGFDGGELNIFRVVKKEWRVGQFVNLTLERDHPTFWDLADAPGDLGSPDVLLPDPWVVAAPTGLAAATGDGISQVGEDGTDIVRVRLTWDPSTDNLVTTTGAMEVRAWRNGDPDLISFPDALGSTSGTVIAGLQDRRGYVFAVRWRNGIGAHSDWRFVHVMALADQGLPDDVTGFASAIKPGQVQLRCNPSTSRRYADTELRYSLVLTDGWDDATFLVREASTEYHFARPANGTYLLLAKHRSSSNRYSANAAVLTVVVDDSVDPGAGESVIVEYSVDGSSGWHSTFATGDLFARWKIGPAGTWTQAFRIVGESGSAGDYVDFVFARSATLPATPTGSTPAGWFDAPPAADGNPLWASTATKTAAGVLVGVWSTPVRIEGAAGAAGDKTAVVYLYQRAASTPALPSAAVTYNFSTHVPSGMNNGWLASIPAGSNPLYVTAATATAPAGNTTDTIAAGEWAAAVILSQDGAAGADGAKTATVLAYQRSASASAPALPSADCTYTFATAGLTGLNNGWTHGVPAAGGAYLWVTTATALSTGATDTITGAEWSAARLMAQDGSAGATGAAAVYAYQIVNSATLPSAPAVPSGAPNGGNASTPGLWYALPPAGSLSTGQWLFQASGTLAGSTYSWISPSYLATFRVGNLAALSADIDGTQSTSVYDPLTAGTVSRSTALRVNSSLGAQIGVFSLGATANVPAVYGYNSGGSGIGVMGYSATGVYGHGSGVGVQGVAGGFGATGVLGTVPVGSNGIGVQGWTSTSADASVGVRAWALNPANIALQVVGFATVSGQIQSTLSTGTAPISVASTTECTNLNAALLKGATWASPGALGSTTPSTVRCTSLRVDQAAIANNAGGALTATNAPSGNAGGALRWLPINYNGTNYIVAALPA